MIDQKRAWLLRW